MISKKELLKKDNTKANVLVIQTSKNCDIYVSLMSEFYYYQQVAELVKISRKNNETGRYMVINMDDLKEYAQFAFPKGHKHGKEAEKEQHKKEI